jgi:VWFA-related protein
MFRTLLLSLILISVSFLSAYSQQSAPAPTPPVADEPAVKISTDLIQVDVTVTDRDGKIVTGLTADDFEITENGQAQPITNLSFINRTRGGATVGGDNKGAVTNGTGPGASTSANTRRTIAIVVDDLNLSFVSVYYLRRALKKFVETQMAPGDLVAIIRTGVGVGALQQFTTDKRLLLASIQRIRWNPLGSGGMDSLASVGQSPEEKTNRFNGESDYVAAKAGNDDSGRKSILIHQNINDTLATDYRPSKAAVEIEAALHAQATLGSMKYIIGGMNELPGRKMMMLFSDGLAINSNGTKSRSAAIYNMLRDLVDEANRSSVVVYTFDTKGMKSMSIQASDSTYEIIDGHRGQKEKERLDTFKQSQEGLAMLADETGGKSLLNSNDLNYGIDRALDEQTGYYLLGYVPDSDTFSPADRKFNKLEVKVKRPGLNVSYRSGFFNSPEGGKASDAASSDKALASALTSPFARSDIAVNINALYANDPNDGPYIRSFLHIDANTLTFTEDAEGWKKATFDVAAAAFGDNGLPVDKVASKYTIKTKGATYDTMLQKGFVYVLVMPLKSTGLLQYRVAVRDEASGKVGSASQIIDVPDLKSQKLFISSLAVEDVSMDTWQNITAGKVGNGPGQIKISSTLPYDTVLKQFPAGSVLRYGYEAYNARADGKGAPKLQAQARILQNDKVIVDGALKKIEPDTIRDPKRVQISGAMMLKDTLAPGDYALQVIVYDTAAKKTATQLFPFELVK